MGMLVITRKVGESFYIGDDIIIKIVSIKGSKARVGVEAPKEMEIERPEYKPLPQTA